MSENNLKLMDKLNHIKNLFLLGKSDENLDENEIDIITQIARQHGLTYKDIDYITTNMDQIPFTLPDHFTDRLSALYDLVLLMVSDFEVHEKETEFCKKIALKYEFNDQIIDELTEDILAFVLEGKECDEVIEYLVKYAHPKPNLN